MALYACLGPVYIICTCAWRGVLPFANLIHFRSCCSHRNDITGLYPFPFALYLGIQQGWLTYGFFTNNAYLSISAVVGYDALGSGGWLWLGRCTKTI